VGHNPDPIAPVLGVDGASRNNKRCCFVTEAFQLSQHIIECQIDDSRHVLTKYPSGPDRLDNAEHLWPEETVIFLAALLPGNTERLARKSTANKVNWFGVNDCADVSVELHLRPVLVEYLLTVGVYLTLPRYLNACAFKTEIKATNAGE
jgi:hypothetical protein